MPFSPALGVNYSLLDYPFAPNNAAAFAFAQSLGCKWFRIDVPWNYTKGSWTSLFGLANPTLLSTSSPITSIPLNAPLTQTVAAGQMTLVDATYAHTQTVTTTGASIGATSVPVTSFTPNFAYTTTSSLFFYNAGAASQIATLKTTAATYGISLLFIVDGCLATTWASGVSGSNYNTGYPITAPQFAAAMQWLVAQSGCQGLHWEIPQNEPDQYQYFAAVTPTPALTVAALKAAYPLMKSADPTCVVHLFPVANVNSGGGGYSYLQGGYTAGMNTGGAGPGGAYYDVFDFHCYQYPGNGPYQTSAAGGNLATVIIPGLVALRSTEGDVTPLWLTETGWQSGGTGLNPEMNPTTQAAYLYSWLLALNSLYPNPVVVCIYDLADAGGQWGMMTGSNVAKLTFAQMQSLTQYTSARVS